MKADKKASKNTFSVIFVIQKGKCRPDGKAPIVARITVNGEMVHFSTKMYIEPERWLPLEYKTKGQTHEEQVINGTLFDFHATIKRKYNDMIYRGEVITASKIKSSILCQDERSMTLIALCNKYIEDYEKLVLTQDYGQESFFRYKVCRNRLQEFLRDEFKVSDLPLQDINKRFLDKLYLWLRSAHRLNNNTAVKFIHRFASIYKMAKDNGWVAADPFKQQKLHLDKVDRGYLTIEEVSRLYNKEFESLRLEQVRDIFIFSCYTGLAYIDVYNLTEDQLNVWADGNTWISFHRQKTKVPFNVRLLDVPLQIIEKYKHFRKGKRLLPIPSNQKCNEYLKEIAEVCGINKNITFHVARHTFATTITLGNGVPIETVSKMLGHTNVRTTQIYARITDQKINVDMESLAAKLNGIFTAPLTPSKESVRREQHQREVQKFAVAAGLA